MRERTILKHQLASLLQARIKQRADGWVMIGPQCEQQAGQRASQEDKWLVQLASRTGVQCFRLAGSERPLVLKDLTAM